MFKYRQLFFLPSFYLLITFSIAYFFYLIQVIKWEEAPAELHFWCFVTILMSMLSVVIHTREFNRIINSDKFASTVTPSFLHSKTGWLILGIITAIGIVGIIKYVIDYSNYLGAFGIFYSIFTEDTGQLRSLAENVDSVGIQLSYFSWLSAFILIIEIASNNISRYWLLVVILILLLNSIFLDRTRPIWIMFTGSLSYFIVRYNVYTRKKIIYFISGITAFFLSIFVLIGAILGKGADDESYLTFDLPNWLQPLFLYLTSSFAYLGHLLFYDAPPGYSPDRVIYPISKILAKAHLAEQPPSQILEFYGVPIMTNVGTFLEPFFQDGGRFFMIAAIILHTFVFDRLSVYFMKRMSSFSIIAIATLCFVNFIAFFVPKITSTATWFLLLSCFLLLKVSSFKSTVNYQTGVSPN